MTQTKEFPRPFATLPEIRRAARARLPREAWNFGDGGSESEATLRRNKRHIDRLAIAQHVLVDVREIDLRTSLLGVPLSGATGWPVEDVARAGGAPQMFQLYHHGDRGWVAELLKRVETSGYKAVALTVDTQHYSRRERDVLARWSPRKAMEVAPNPRGPFHDYQMRLTWADVEWLIKTTKLPVGLKGIMTVADARRAVEVGVRLIWVSNHGGRQLDHTQSSIEALPPIVEAVAGRAEVVIDGGFSSGTAVLKGLARGAKVVMLGRTSLWGLGADGAEGVARVFEILRDQLHVAMGLCGRTKISDLKPDLIFRAD